MLPVSSERGRTDPKTVKNHECPWEISTAAPFYIGPSAGAPVRGRSHRKNAPRGGHFSESQRLHLASTKPGRKADIDALIVRPIGGGSTRLQQIAFITATSQMLVRCANEGPFPFYWFTVVTAERAISRPSRSLATIKTDARTLSVEIVVSSPFQSAEATNTLPLLPEASISLILRIPSSDSKVPNTSQRATSVAPFQTA
jgi:hypothetical protein